MSKSEASAGNEGPGHPAEGQLGRIGDRLKSLIPTGVWSSLSPASRISTGEEEREAYIHEVRHEIMGWNGTGALRLVHEIGKHQAALGVRGSVAEIGVHHGQLLIFLMMLMRQNEHAVAIDLFEDQHLNIDNSGKGDREILMGNVSRYCPRSQERLSVMACDSTKLKVEDILKAGRKPVRIFSVDGGHTRDVVLSDLILAAASLHEGGVVVLDDVFNMYFPGVGEGLADYVHGKGPGEGKRLAPFAIGCNKVLLAFEPWRQKYVQLLEKSAVASCIKGKAIGWGVTDIPVFEM